MVKVSSGFQELLDFRRKLFTKYFINSIYPLVQQGTHKRLASAVLYSLEAGGKKFRPVLTLSSYLVGSSSSPSRDALVLAAAVELIHTYSLVHDDLPSMDNDELRRGIPTCHKKFSESTAILAGDALNSLGFYLVSRVEPKENDPQLIPDLYDILHEGAGISGMVSGQSEDLELEGKYGMPPEESRQNPEETLYRIHSKKTGGLIQAAMLLGNRLRPDSNQRKENLIQYSKKLGLLFQITDDILDVIGDVKDLGKTPGKDASHGKLTFVTLYGMDQAKKMVESLVQEMVELAKALEPTHEIFFKELPFYIANRKS